MSASRFTIVADDERVLVRDHRPVRAACVHGAPGLWRAVPTSACALAIFEVAAPSTVADRVQAGRAFRALHEPIIAWAIATADGRAAEDALPDWTAPPRNATALAASRSAPLPVPDMRSSVPAPHMAPSARGGLKRELVWKPRHIALRFPLVVRSAPPWSGPRLELARGLCGLAHSRWRYGRFHLAVQQDADSISAEVDLTGAPHGLLLELLGDARDALLYAVERLAPPLALLNERALDAPLAAHAAAWMGRASSNSSDRDRAPASGWEVTAGSSLPPRPLQQTTLPW
ncbi:MAG: hypothetical protein R3F49_06085 [Planctomycetota bacterium]